MKRNRKSALLIALCVSLLPAAGMQAAYGSELQDVQQVRKYDASREDLEESTPPFETVSKTFIPGDETDSVTPPVKPAAEAPAAKPAPEAPKAPAAKPAPEAPSAEVKKPEEETPSGTQTQDPEEPELTEQDLEYWFRGIDEAKYAEKLHDAAYTTPTTGVGYCASWVSYVYQAAGLGFVGGNACDMWQFCCTSHDTDMIHEGMIIAVRYSSASRLGMIYGHCGILLRNPDYKGEDHHGQIIALKKEIDALEKDRNASKDSAEKEILLETRQALEDRVRELEETDKDLYREVKGCMIQSDPEGHEKWIVADSTTHVGTSPLSGWINAFDYSNTAAWGWGHAFSGRVAVWEGDLPSTVPFVYHEENEEKEGLKEIYGIDYDNLTDDDAYWAVCWACASEEGLPGAIKLDGGAVVDTDKYYELLGHMTQEQSMRWESILTRYRREAEQRAQEEEAQRAAEEEARAKEEEEKARKEEEATQPETKAQTSQEESKAQPETKAQQNARTETETTAVQPQTEAPTEAVTEAPTEAAATPQGETQTQGQPEPQTQAPYEEVTEPVTEVPTEQVTEPATEAPTEQVTQAPAEETTNPPAEVQTDPPVEETINPPVEETTNPPVEETTNPPVEETTNPPVEETTNPPVEETTDPPVEVQTDPPVETPAEPPVEVPVDPPVVEETPAPEANLYVEETPAE